MAVSAAGLSDGDFFTSLGMLIIQGRKWDAFRRTRGRGLHCPTVRNSSPPHHQCSPNNVECQTALSFRNTIHAIWLSGGAVVIDVVLLPECGHQEPARLIEKWSLRPTNEASTMPELSLMQAIDSMIHFSQLCSWWSSTNGCQPRNVQYKVYEVDEPNMNLLKFTETPLCHCFMVSHGVKVTLQYLPRQKTIPDLYCWNCTIRAQQMEIGSPSRGRNFLHRGHRRASRHSSASSDSVSPVSRVDKSPFGSPLFSSCFRAPLSSSSSSRGSSRTGSPCVSRSPSERSLIMAFESHQRIEELDEERSEGTGRYDSGFIDNTSKDNFTIDQDEELANQLDSLSDSDLSDDYVIDGPVGSPGLVGTPIASPDDSRVQMLQSTFAGFHCRHPTFDRLMSDTVGAGNRVRHSSLDSAVSNFERLDLRTRRRLSRTNSDGQDFENLRGNPEPTSEKELLIRDIKKRHKLQGTNAMDYNETPRCTSNNTYYASFRTEEDADTSSILEFCGPPDDFSSNFMNFNRSRPHMNSTPTGFVTMSQPSSPSLPLTPFIDPQLHHCESTQVKKPTVTNNFRKETPLVILSRSPSVEHLKDQIDLQKVNETPNVNLKSSKAPEEPANMLQESANSQAATCHESCHTIVPITTSTNSIRQACENVSVDKKQGQQVSAESSDSDANGSSCSALLRSPPSKLRILPSHCIEKNYLHNPPRQPVHKLSANTQCGPARRLQFNQSEKPCTSPAPIRRNNSVRFEFDEDMPKLNQRSSRSACRGKCMKKNDIIVHNHTHLTPTHRLLGSFEESIIHNRLEVLGSVDGFHAQLGASGSFCPSKVKLPVPVRFFHVSDDNAPSPYMGTMSLKGRECGKRGYHIPRKGTIQLTLFNPNNSVVKVFVILYDVNDMPPGHRTFLRHRIFSKATTATKEVDQNGNHVKRDTATSGKKSGSKYLRYFVHLWLESSKTNKIYIHGDIKILFSLASNEWDSGNTFELETETEFPKNPKYSSKR